LLMAVPRQQRMALLKQVMVLQDSLEGEVVAPWVGAEWTTEQCEAVGELMARVVSLEDSKEAGEGAAVLSAVTSLLSALDSVSESFVDRAEVLLVAVQGGGEAGATALAGVLEHGVAVLEALCATTPRRGRKLIDATSERAEEMLEFMDEGGLITQLSSCEESCLVGLCERLCAVEALRAGGEDVDAGSAVACVEALLEELGRCGDPVVGARRLLGSSEAGQRLRVLSVLSALPRVVLEAACDAEVGCVDLMVGMLSKEGGRSVAERTSAALGLFTLCLRNTTVPVDFENSVSCICSPFREWTEATPDDIGAASELLAAIELVGGVLFFDMQPKLGSDSPDYARIDKFITGHTSVNGVHSPEFRALLTVERCQQLLPVIIKMLTHPDVIMA
jgi:hypothetical protein